MKRYQQIWVALAIVAFLGVAQNLYYWSQLPETVATHFGMDGKPNQWMSRTASTCLMIGLQLGLPLFLIAVTAATRHLPVSLVNIPNREYWLDPIRKDSTLEYMQSVMGWIALSVSIFMMVIGHLVYLANLEGGSLNSMAFGISLGIYLILVLSLVVRMVLRFRISQSKLAS